VKWIVEKVKGRRIETDRLVSEEPWADEAFEGGPHSSFSSLEAGSEHLS
jgi:hypothetical protein